MRKAPSRRNIRNKEKAMSKKERFFNINIIVSGDPSEPFDPLPWLKGHIQVMKKEGLFPKGIYFLENDAGENAACINTASFEESEGEKS